MCTETAVAANPIERVITITDNQKPVDVLRVEFPNVYVADYSTYAEDKFWVGNNTDTCSFDGQYVHLHPVEGDPSGTLFEIHVN